MRQLKELCLLFQTLSFSSHARSSLAVAVGYEKRLAVRRDGDAAQRGSRRIETMTVSSGDREGRVSPRTTLLASSPLATPRNGIVEVAGAERAPFNEIVAYYLEAVG